MPIGQYISIITLDVNRLNSQIQRLRLAKWIQKQVSCWLQETHFRPKDTYRLKKREWKNMFHVNGYQNKASITILISDKIDLKIKEYYKRLRRILHNDQGINPRRRPNTCKYLCTQHRSPSIHKVNNNKPKRGN